MAAATDRTQRIVEGDVMYVLVNCIHCNTKLSVCFNGVTNATLEHIQPLCSGGSPDDPHNLALACARCNNKKGIDHDQHAGKGGRADEVISALKAKREERWCEPSEFMLSVIAMNKRIEFSIQTW